MSFAPLQSRRKSVISPSSSRPPESALRARDAQVPPTAGRPLETGTRDTMEPRLGRDFSASCVHDPDAHDQAERALGHDFSRVRVHADRGAAASARALAAPEARTSQPAAVDLRELLGDTAAARLLGRVT
jgi:uncharacterized protein DUF4157